MVIVCLAFLKLGRAAYKKFSSYRYREYKLNWIE